MTYEHQESRKRTFYVFNCPSITSLPGHTLFTQVCFVPSALDFPELIGWALGVQDFTGDGKCICKECYSWKTIAFTYNTFGLGLLLGTLINGLNSKGQFRDTGYPIYQARPDALAKRSKMNQTGVLWIQLSSHVLLGFYDASEVGRSNSSRHHSMPVTF